VNRHIIILAVALSVIVGGCGRVPRSAEDRASRFGAAAVDSEQARLWREAAARREAPGLDRLPLVSSTQRGPSQAIPNRPVAARPVEIPPSIPTAVRVLDAPANLPAFTGSAQVAAVSGDRIDLDLGGGSRLTVLARRLGKPLGVVARETIRLDYALAADPETGRARIAVRRDSGEGVFRLIEGGREPAAAALMLFGVTARQIGKPLNGSMEVELLLAGAPPVRMTPRVVITRPPLAVTLIGSEAPTDGRGVVDGPPYWFELLGWTVP
jgi:hypothetical protein